MSRPMKNSGIAWIGQVPRDWGQALIGSLYKVRNTKVSDKQFEPLSVTMRGILPQLENAAKTNDGDNRKLVRKGDFAINSRSDRRGACGISNYDGSVSLINLVLVPQNNMHPGYYNWLFHTSAFADEFYKWGHGIVDDLWTTRWQDMKNITIPLPSLQEQQRIAGYLDKKCAEIDTLSNNIQQQIDTLEQYKRAVITETVTKGLNPSAPMKDSGIPWIGKVPQHWDLNKLKYVTTKLERGTSPDYTDEELTRVVNQATFSRGFFNDKDIKFSTKPAAGSRGLLKRYDVLLASTGGWVLGKTHFFDEVETYVADGHVTIARANEKKILSKLLYYLFFINFDTFNALMTKGSTNQTELQSLDLANMFIPVPPLSEQQQIIQVLDRHTQTIARAIHSKQQQLEKLEQYKKATIFEYVTGKKQVPEV